MNSLSRAGLIILLILAVATGIWLNNTAWRNRRLIWQLQAAVIAGGVGFIAGRITAFLLNSARVRAVRLTLTIALIPCSGALRNCSGITDRCYYWLRKVGRNAETCLDQSALAAASCTRDHLGQLRQPRLHRGERTRDVVARAAAGARKTGSLYGRGERRTEATQCHRTAEPQKIFVARADRVEGLHGRLNDSCNLGASGAARQAGDQRMQVGV